MGGQQGGGNAGLSASLHYRPLGLSSAQTRRARRREGLDLPSILRAPRVHQWGRLLSHRARSRCRGQRRCPRRRRGPAGGRVGGSNAGRQGARASPAPGARLLAACCQPCPPTWGLVCVCEWHLPTTRLGAAQPPRDCDRSPRPARVLRPDASAARPQTADLHTYVTLCTSPRVLPDGLREAQMLPVRAHAPRPVRPDPSHAGGTCCSCSKSKRSDCS